MAESLECELDVCEYGMLECWNSGGAILGNFYILTIVVI